MDERQQELPGLFLVGGVEKPLGDAERRAHEERAQWRIGQGARAVLLAGSEAKGHCSSKAPLGFPIKGLRKRWSRGEGTSGRPREEYEAEQGSQIGEVIGGGDEPADAWGHGRAGRVEELQKPSLKTEEMLQRLRVGGNLETSLG